MNLTSTFSAAWLIPIIVIAGGLAFWLYRKDKILNDQPFWVSGLLFTLRFVSLTVLGYLMLEPMIKMVGTELQKPIIAVAIDNSSSILNASDSVYYKTELKNDLLKLSTEISDKFDVETFSFDKEIKNGFDIDFKGDETNLSNLAEELDTRFFNRNLAGVVIATDGNYNQGFNPVYATNKPGAPIYTVVLGDTARVSDMTIKGLFHNKIAFLNDDFPVELMLEASGFENRSFKIKVYHNKQVVYETKGTVENNRWNKRFNFYLKADEIGIQRYYIVIETDKQEVVKVNNKETFYIDVLDERIKIAIITATPHPDVAVWKRAIEGNKNYEVAVFEANKFNKNIADYQLFILYQTPTDLNQTALLDLIKRAKIPYLIVLGLSSNANLLSQTFDNYQLKLTSNTIENFKVGIDDNFSLFSIDEQFKEYLDAFPPLSSRVFNIDINQPYQKLFTKKVGSLDTDIPVWILSESTTPRNGLIIGEGIWRWSMAAWSFEHSHQVFDDFLLQTIKYLSRKVKNKRFKVNIPGPIYSGESIEIKAHLLNLSLEPVKSADIHFSLTDEDGNNFEYAFIETTDIYELNLGTLNPGEYTYVAKVELGKETLYDKGKFTIRKKMFEQRDNRANMALLHQWSEKTGGKLYFPDQLIQLTDILNEKDMPVISYQTERFINIVKLNWIFFIIFALLSIEWFLRRFYGTY